MTYVLPLASLPRVEDLLPIAGLGGRAPPFAERPLRAPLGSYVGVPSLPFPARAAAEETVLGLVGNESFAAPGMVTLTGLTARGKERGDADKAWDVEESSEELLDGAVAVREINDGGVTWGSAHAKFKDRKSTQARPHHTESSGKWKAMATSKRILRV